MTNPIPQRHFQDDVYLSIVGFGGIAVCGHEQKLANNIVAETIDRGVNYFDVAPTYADGEAEEKLGVALQGKRNGVFLACKSHRRDAAAARQDLETSLRRLRTDHFDLYQFHAVTTLEEVERTFAPGGAAEVFLKAREEGKIRYIGFSAHSEEAALALMDRFDFDSVLFPINYVCYAQGDFGPRVVQRAQEKGVARLALKSLAQTKWKADEEKTFPYCWYRPWENREKALRALRFTLNEPITAAIPPGDAGLFRLCLDLASEVTPLSDDERAEILKSAREIEAIFETIG